jgi:cyclophilin family peptidyl-prolyl cis-trans isomerase/HEAT repeat protein
MIKRFLVLSLMLVISASSSFKPVNKFSDPIQQTIAEAKDRRDTKQVLPFLSNANHVYRREAALALGSIQDATATAPLASLLQDQQPAVRLAAAWALGQTGGTATAPWLIRALSGEKNLSVRGALLEALGKTITADQLGNFSADTKDFDGGLSWYFYRMGLRGIADSSAVRQAKSLLQAKYKTNTRLGAAHFFARGPASIDAAATELLQAAAADPEPEVRMACASALRKIKTESSFEALRKIISQDADYRVRINAVRAVGAFTPAQKLPVIESALQDKHEQVRIAASEVMIAAADVSVVTMLEQSAKQEKDWRVRANLLDALLRVQPTPAHVAMVQKIYQEETNAYARAALLTALARSVVTIQFIMNQISGDQPAVVRTAATSALTSMNRLPEFDSLYKKQMAEFFPTGFAVKDPAVMGILADMLSTPEFGYKNLIRDYDFLYDARKSLSLPKDNESLQPIEAAIAYLEGRKTPAVENPFNHPIDWSAVKNIHRDARAIITTAKGQIVMRLLVEEAPGSVVNFVQLAKSGYFNNKNFHRVVPNFVIQGGCNRGDGYGGEDYSIRSEFSERKYAIGSVGMASAGKDTEGTQWFITHSPTPHLDGRYTIFAEVVSGMEVVHTIGVGDLILKVEIR